MIGTGTIWRYFAKQRICTVLTAMHVVSEALEQGDVKAKRGWLTLHFLHHAEGGQSLLLDAANLIEYEEVSGFAKIEKGGNLTAPRASADDPARKLDCALLHFRFPEGKEWDDFASLIREPIPTGRIAASDNPTANPANQGGLEYVCSCEVTI